MKRASLFGLFVLVTLAIAQTTYKLVINGHASPGSAIVVSGETYVPLKALQSAGVKANVASGTLTLTFPPATGGAMQVSAVEGGLNEWLFNGIWRFRVLSVNQAADGSGWEVKVELRNGTKQDALALSGTGFDGLKLVFGDGKMLDTSAADFVSQGFPQGGGQEFTLVFGDDAAASHKPDKLLLLIRPDAELKKYLHDRLSIAYSVPDPSFRVKIGGS